MSKKTSNSKEIRSSSEFDHRKTGLDKGLFCFPQEGGAGFPFWLPRGYKLIEIIRDYINSFQEEVCGIKLVKTPLLGKKQLYHKTGHLQLYSDNIFESIKEDGEEFILRPMTCPHHILLAKEIIQGYRQLPYAIGENSILHRHEYSGGLIGLKRVRSMELIDTHIFCLEEQCKEVIISALSGIGTLLQKFKVKVFEIVLATRSEKFKYLMKNEEWEKAEEILFSVTRNGAFENELYPKIVERMGEAAFYGPKIDFNVVDNSGQNFTVSTLQLDTLMCEKLDFQVYDLNQKLIAPGVLHLGLIGTLERFVAYLLERGRGILPFGLSPVQATIIPIAENKYSKESGELVNNLKRYGFRAEIDFSRERIQKKIFNSTQEHTKIQIFMGDKEAKNPSIVSFRKLGDTQPKELLFPEFIDYLQKLSLESQKI